MEFVETVAKAYPLPAVLHQLTMEYCFPAFHLQLDYVRLQSRVRETRKQIHAMTTAMGELESAFNQREDVRHFRACNFVDK